MAVYIFLGKRTPEGNKTIKERPSPASAEYTKKLGLKVIDYYYTLGPYDYVSILEGPDDPATYFKIAAFGSIDGTVSWTALPALRSEEFAKVIQALPTAPTRPTS